MPEYYQNTEIDYGTPATSAEINQMQRMIDMALDQIQNDEFSGQFVLDPTQDAFILTPATDIVDQENQNGSSWLDITDVYLRETLDLVKSSIKNFYVILQNNADTPISVAFQLRQIDLTNDAGTILQSLTMEIPTDTVGSIYQVSFETDHLPAGPYYVVLKRTNYEGIMVQYDNSGNYNQSLCTSVDDNEYDEIGADLWFKEEYGTSTTFDLTGSIAIMGGQKTQNLDTHITLSSGSGQGDRVDLVCLTQNGELDVVSSLVSNNPTLADGATPFGYLPLGLIYVAQNVNDSRMMTINQDDSLGVYRLRSHHERLRRLEKLTTYMEQYDSIERIKYTVCCGNCPSDCSNTPFMDESASYNIANCSNGVCAVNNCSNGPYMLSNDATETRLWTFLADATHTGDENLNLTASATIDHSDHVNGIVKLILTTTPGTPGTPAIIGTDTKTWLGGVDRDPSQRALPVMGGDEIDVYSSNSPCYYPGLYFYCWNEGPLSYGQLDIEFYKNCDYAYYVLFKVSDNTSIGSGRPELVEVSAPYQIAGNPAWVQNWSNYAGNNIQYQQGAAAPAPIGIFSGTQNITQGMYLLLLAMVPLNNSEPAQCWTNTWLGAGYPPADSRYANYTIYSGWYPMKTIIADPPNAQRLGIIENKRNNYVMSGGLISEVITQGAPATPGTPATSAYQSPGTLQSTVWDPNAGSNPQTYYGIESCTINMNLTLPDNTYYELYVSNDKGTTFFKMSGKTFNFTNTNAGNPNSTPPSNPAGFVWKLIFYTNDSTQTPLLSYESDDGFALSASIGLTGGTITDGCLVTLPFDGDYIIRQLLGLPSTDNEFSNWQWASIFATGPLNAADSIAAGVRLLVDIEASDDGTNWVKKISGLYLDDFFNGSIDYSNYTGSFAADEYNYNLTTDIDTQTDTILIDDFSEAGISISEITTGDNDVTVSTTTIINPAGTDISPTSISINKMTVTSGFVAGTDPTMMIYKAEGNGIDLSPYNQLTFYVSSDTEIEEGDLEFCLLNTIVDYNVSQPTAIIESHELPALPANADGLVQVIIELESPISELKNVQGFGIAMNQKAQIPENTSASRPIPPLTSGFNYYIGYLEGLTTTSYPLYERYLRLRICMHRDDPSFQSPSVRGIRVVPVLT